jgi:hypothetical protein
LAVNQAPKVYYFVVEGKFDENGNPRDSKHVFECALCHSRMWAHGMDWHERDSHVYGIERQSEGGLKMKHKYFIFLVIVAFVTLLYAPIVSATSILGTAGETFAVLGHEAVSNTSPSTIVGNVGVSPGVGISGFNHIPGTAVSDPQVTPSPQFLVHQTTTGPGSAAAALADAGTAYTGLANMPFLATNDFTGTPTLGGRTLPSGVYHFDAAAGLTGTLTLDAEFKNNAYWVFQIGSALTTASSSVVQVIHLGSNGGIDDGVFWQIGSDATLGGGVGAGTQFEGNILALGSVTLITNATDLNGRVFALTGAVTLDQNTIEIICPNGGPGYSGGLVYGTEGHVVPIGPSGGGGGGQVPEPATMLLLGSGLIGLAGFARRKFKK